MIYDINSGSGIAPISRAFDFMVYGIEAASTG
jgi:hypothetical protein